MCGYPPPVTVVAFPSSGVESPQSLGHLSGASRSSAKSWCNYSPPFSSSELILWDASLPAAAHGADSVVNFRHSLCVPVREGALGCTQSERDGPAERERG